MDATAVKDNGKKRKRTMMDDFAALPEAEQRARRSAAFNNLRNVADRARRYERRTKKRPYGTVLAILLSMFGKRSFDAV